MLQQTNNQTDQKLLKLVTASNNNRIADLCNQVSWLVKCLWRFLVFFVEKKQI